METMTSQRGVALPVALIMLVVMLFSGIYLMRASNNATIMSSNLAYERDISRRADFGLSAGYDWLSGTANNLATKPNLDQDQLASGYNSLYRGTVGNYYRSIEFWANAVTVNDPAGNPVQYVIHRMCAFAGRYNDAGQQCVQTKPIANVDAAGAAAGSSLSSDTDSFMQLPQIHYVITSRVPGVKGASVINQLVVTIGA
jgi:hypothetical protein